MHVKFPVGANVVGIAVVGVDVVGFGVGSYVDPFLKGDSGVAVGDGVGEGVGEGVDAGVRDLVGNPSATDGCCVSGDSVGDGVGGSVGFLVSPGIVGDRDGSTVGSSV